LRSSAGITTWGYWLRFGEFVQLGDEPAVPGVALSEALELVADWQLAQAAW
jgi:hypothetical protein